MRLWPFLLLGLLGCQPPPAANMEKDIVGVWLRSDAPYIEGVNQSGGTKMFEVYQTYGRRYLSIEHKFGKTLDEYTITTGTWTVSDGDLAFAYFYKYVFTGKPLKGKAVSVMLGTGGESGALAKVSRFDKGHLEYDHPSDGKLSFVSGEVPPGFDKDLLDLDSPHYKSIRPFP